MRARTSAALFASVAAVVFTIDRITKLMALDALQERVIELFPCCRLSLAFNTGVSFSLFASSTGSSSFILIALIAVIVTAFIIAWRFYSTRRTTDWAFGLIVGGAIGNFVDRLSVGGVIDFIQLYYQQYSWPIFNVADCAITLGFLILVIEVFYHEAATP
jgi:signal peptidase II